MNDIPLLPRLIGVRLAALIPAIALTLAACAAGGAEWTFQPTPAATPVPSGAPSATPTAAGTPNPNVRTVKIGATAQLRFVPDSVTVKKGETIHFEVTNTAGFPHNFVVGPKADVEAKNESALSKIPDWSSGTQTIDYTFSGNGPYEYACFIPGHFESGMKGTVTVQP